jgi:DNA-binding CsgD family transcriptional regulator
MEKDFAFMSDRDWSSITARFRLSPRECETLQLILAGRTSEELEKKLQLSRPAVKKVLMRLYRKVGARDRIDLALRVTRGIMPRTPPATSEWDAGEQQSLP